MAQQIISCPNCGQTVRVSDELMRQRVRCPHCAATFAADRANDAASADFREPPPEEANERWEDDLAKQPRDRRPRDFDLDAYRPTSGLATAAMFLIVAAMVADLVGIWSGWLQYELANKIINGSGQAHLQEIEDNDRRQLMVGVAQIVLLLIAAIVFICWFHRLYANLPTLGAGSTQHGAGWAAGAWFVPILNLFRPYQIAQESFRKSNPDIDGGERSTSQTSALVVLWWTAWIASGIVGQVAFRMAMNAESPQAIRSATVAAMISDVSGLVAGLLVLGVIRVLDQRQTARYQAAASAEPRWSRQRDQEDFD